MATPFPKPARRLSSRRTGEPQKRARPCDTQGETGRQERPGRQDDSAPGRAKPKKPLTPSSGASNRTSGADFSNSSVPEAMSAADFADREDSRVPMLPGMKPVLELLENTPERVDTVFLRKGRHSADMARIIDLCRDAGVRFALLEPPVFAGIYSSNTQGVVARLFEAGYTELEDLLDAAPDALLPLILAFDQIQDPGNAGTLARTAYALGGAGIIVPRYNGVYLGAAAAKAAAGALERLPVAKTANLGQALDKARERGITVYGASSGVEPAAADGKERGIALRSVHKKNAVLCLDAFSAEYRLPALLVLGNEAEGLRPGIEKRCDFLLHIPMVRKFDSLNVAQAGAILISFFARSWEHNSK